MCDSVYMVVITGMRILSDSVSAARSLVSTFSGAVGSVASRESFATPLLVSFISTGGRKLLPFPLALFRLFAFPDTDLKIKNK